MEKFFNRLLILFLALCFDMLIAPNRLTAQAQQGVFVLDGGYLNLSEGTVSSPMYFVVNDASPVAITRPGGKGHIYTQGQYNFVKWNTDTGTGNFIFPFGVGGADSNYIPFSFHKISSGSSNITASTWNTDPQNMPHPGLSGVSAISDMTGVGDSLTGAIDRFWDVRTSGPATADLTYSYLGSENTLTSPTGLLQMQRWTGNANSPWTVPQGLGNIGVTTGIGMVGPVMGQTVFSPCVLVGIADFLGKGGGSICTTVYPSNNRNYVTTETLQKAETIENNLNALVVNDKLTRIQYLDGLGRPLETIAVNAAPNYNHLVTFNRYDNFGREAKTYLPYASSKDCAGFILDPFTEQVAFYNTAPDIEHSTYPFAETVFEPSPLNRVTTQGAAGADWQISSNHTTKLETSSNIANEVRNYDLNSSSVLYYEAGALYKKLLRDENWTVTDGSNHTTEEFTDKEGHLVLKRSYNNAVPHDTYYLYDIYGNQTTVIPPEAVPAFVPNNAGTQAQLDNLCYQYKWDEFNRPIEKKIPGKGWEYIVYDKLDRPVLTQDANERALHQWSFIKYDAFGRNAYTGIYTVTADSTRQVLQTTLNILLTPLYENKNATPAAIGDATVYYSNNAYPKVNLQLLTINYYDDYVFNTDGLIVPISVYGIAPITKLTGMPTGTKVWVVNTREWITNLTAYDRKERPIYTAIKNPYLDFTETTENQFDFSGNVKESKTTHNKYALASMVVIDKMSYDHAGRLLRSTQKINAETEELISSNAYNQIGALIRKDIGNDAAASARLQTVNYAYNIRGWLTQMNNPVSLGNDLMAFALNFNSPQQAGSAPLYNGNISEAQWKTASDNQQRSYAYHYDDLSRIQSADYFSAENNRYNSSNISYDKNGNILTLNRNGWQNNASNYNNLDVLSYAYNGNQLLAVTDSGSIGYGFIDGNTSGDDYTYDANGNMNTDKNKKITSITYNRLNLPETIVVNGTAPLNGTITYVYDANGVKQSKTSTPNGGQATTVQYAGSFEYQSNGVTQYDLQFISQPEGYVTPYTDGTGTHYRYVYQYKDHLGNVRLSYTDQDATAGINLAIIEESNYYEFGMKHQGYNTNISSLGNSRAQMFKYNGKELQDEFGLNLYDYGARFYDPSIGRWGGPDPHADSYPSWSPYSFTFCNPIYFIDPTGMDPSDFEDKDGNKIAHVEDGSNAVYQLTGDNKSNEYFKFKGFDEKQGGKNVVSVPGAIEGAQNYTKENYTSDIDAKGNCTQTYCNYGTMNIAKTAESASTAAGQPLDITDIKGSSRDIGSNLAKSTSVTPATDLAAAKTAAGQGKLVIGYWPGHVFTLNKSGLVNNVGAPRATNNIFDPKYTEGKGQKFYIINAVKSSGVATK